VEGPIAFLRFVGERARRRGTQGGERAGGEELNEYDPDRSALCVFPLDSYSILNGYSYGLALWRFGQRM
jgi:hypothetical protein